MPKVKLSTKSNRKSARKGRNKHISVSSKKGCISKELSDADAFDVIARSFRDGLAIFNPCGQLVFFNKSYPDLYQGVEDIIAIGVKRDDIFDTGLARSVFDTQNLSSREWLKQFAVPVDVGETEHYVKFSDGRWILRRNTRICSGYTLELCSDLTKWKEREVELNEAVRRAECAEQDLTLALRYEEERMKEERLLSKLNQWLHSCKRIEELHQVVKTFLSRLLPSSSGTLYVYNFSRDVLVPACSWNTAVEPIEIRSDDCWGLRQGKAYYFGHDGWTFKCDHMPTSEPEQEQPKYFCIPIVAHGDTAGMLNIIPPVNLRDKPNELQHVFKIACICAEQVSLAIANVMLGEQLKNQSTRDSLTNLFNRRFFIERCAREVEKSCRFGLHSSIIALDIDHFKKFNDSYGHEAGDVVLKAFARVLLEHFRADDIVCRAGGEEFTVLLPGAEEHIGIKRAEELLPKVQKMQVRYGNETLPPITVSAGVVSVPESGNCVQTVLNKADRALYAAKGRGRNCVVSSQGIPKVSIKESAPRGQKKLDKVPAPEA